MKRVSGPMIYENRPKRDRTHEVRADFPLRNVPVAPRDSHRGSGPR